MLETKHRVLHKQLCHKHIAATGYLSKAVNLKVSVFQKEAGRETLGRP